MFADILHSSSTKITRSCRWTHYNWLNCIRSHGIHYCDWPETACHFTEHPTSTYVCTVLAWERKKCPPLHVHLYRERFESYGAWHHTNPPTVPILEGQSLFVKQNLENRTNFLPFLSCFIIWPQNHTASWYICPYLLSWQDFLGPDSAGWRVWQGSRCQAVELIERWSWLRDLDSTGCWQ
jgi:hypothetical protein